MTLPNDSKNIWIAVGKQVFSAAIAVGAVVFFFGGREAKINDVVAWKNKTEPVIQRMETSGTLSFDLFHKEYERTQHRQEEELKELEKQVREIEKKVDP